MATPKCSIAKLLLAGYCLGCKHFKVKTWVPYHPLFECTNGGEVDERTGQTLRCPNAMP